MERAPLRPIPARPHGPVTVEEAVRHVTAALPRLAEREATALALVALAGLPRAEAAERGGVSEAELAETLARARKVLRRSVTALAGSGWCERAERLISDRLDGDLSERDATVLDVHLRNCPRCVEHERRLVQASDALVAAFDGVRVTAPQRAALPAPGALELSAAPPAPGPPELSLVGAEAAAASQDTEPPPLEAVAERGRREVAVLAAWRVLIVLGVLLAIAAVALGVAAALGADL
jgi:predicted DNA-binding protein (UPF0251 family)